MKKNIFLIMLLVVFLDASEIHKLQPSIVNGIQVPESDDTWRAIVALKNGDKQFCAGDLIAPKWVLTAAHCIGVYSNFTVGAKSYNRNTTTTYTVARTIVHPDNNHDDLDNDIALIELNEAVVGVTPIAYDTATNDRPNSTSLETAGWGMRDMGDNSGSTHLMEASVPLNNRDTCNNLDTPYNGSVTDNMLCAGNLSGGSGVCHGDSGGPLIVNNTLIGIVSWGGHPCAGENKPGIYTNVKRYAGWIADSIDEGAEIPIIAFNEDVSSSWTVDKPSIHRPGKYAKYYQFTLDSETEVTIDLTSSVDTYLYLLNGVNEEGTVVTRDDDGGEGRNSRITRTLPAGTYTIEATTYGPAQTGDFVVKVTKRVDEIPTIPFNEDIRDSWTADKPSTHRPGKYAKYYQFTLDSETEVTIDLTSSVDTYLYLLNEEGTVVTRDDDGGEGRNSRITRTLPAGTYTIEATTYGPAQTGDFVVKVTKRVDEIPTITFDEDVSSSWTADKPSTHRPGKYAKYYQFTLDSEREVTIDLTSSVDTYLYLLNGANEEGTVVTRDDDGGEGRNSRITRILPAGTYTIEATTYRSAQTGNFTVLLN